LRKRHKPKILYNNYYHPIILGQTKNYYFEYEGKNTFNGTPTKPRRIHIQFIEGLKQDYIIAMLSKYIQRGCDATTSYL